MGFLQKRAEKKRWEKEYEEQKQRDLDVWLDEVENGNVPKVMMVQPNISLKKDEEVFASLINISLMEPRSVRQYQAGNRGVSLRVAKGVSIRFGNTRGISESHEELKVIDSGSLVVTNKRIVFIGTKRTTNIDMKKIISMEPFTDAVGVSRQGKQKREYFLIDQNLFDMTLKVEDRMHQVPFSGQILMTIMVGASKYSPPEPPIYKQKTVKQVRKVRRIEEETEEAIECPSCGTIVLDVALFCSGCGRKMK